MLGATLSGDRCQFRVWAPGAKQLEVELAGSPARRLPMAPIDEGYHVLEVEGIRAGQLYWYVVDGRRLPDPCSRFQPQGPHGPSMVVDRRAYRWKDQGWQGVELTGLVLYELHIGTFTQEGTFAAAVEKLPHLRELGVNAVEVMPLAECPGRFNWGYDGVDWFAPSHNYGGYDAFKAFVDAAHALGIGVILDVVYNHFGPDGNYLRCFSPHYFSERGTAWGESIDYDGPHSAAVREMVIASACEWIREFHVDGFRLDATHAIFDGSPCHILAELAAAVRQAAGGRRVLVIAENESEDTIHLLPPAEGGYGLDAMWNDDFHHSAMVAATGRREAHYQDYFGTAQELVSASVRGFLYQGQYYPRQNHLRGAPLRGSLAQCVSFLQNHDQVANSVTGKRLHQLASPGALRALTATLLLGPQTPLLFMGQEFAASTPFLFFADHHDELARLVYDGRREFLAQFPGARSTDGRRFIADPADEATFRRCKLDWRECTPDNPVLRLHRDLLALRREDPVLRGQGRRGFGGAVLDQHAFVLRWFDEAEGDRLLVVNLGCDIRDRALPEPLLAPPRGRTWQLRWSSDHIGYGGSGTVDPAPEHGWLIPGQSAMLLAAVWRTK
jgi:maltooligosyltrehalose trehalohydrolase